MGNRLKQTDANGNTTTFTYDAMGRLKTKVYPDGAMDNYSYDAAGRVLTKSTAGETISYNYDQLGREISREYSNSGHVVSTSYNADGSKSGVSDYRGTTFYNYDSKSRVTKVTNPDGTSISYTYDQNGSITERSSGFNTVRYTYDQSGRLNTIDASGNVTTHTYNANGMPIQTSFPNGMIRTREYDDLNRVEKILYTSTSSDTLAFYDYNRNSAGIITQAKELNDTANYVYDDMYRLTSESRTGANVYTTAYTYDAVGNRLSENKNGILTNYSYNNRDQLTQKGVEAFSYDAVGRLVGSGSKTYSWADNDRLTSFSDVANSQNYTYDHNGLRIQAGSKQYLYDMTLPYGQVVAEFGVDTVAYVFGNERVSETRGGVTYYYLIDGQGSIRGLVDSTTSVVGTRDYSAFGEVIAESGVMGDFGYTGEQFDEVSKLLYLRARWMNPANGGVVSVDPDSGDVNNPTSLVRYLYANGSPVSYSDPSGEKSIMELSVTTVGRAWIASAATAGIASILQNEIGVLGSLLQGDLKWTGSLISLGSGAGLDGLIVKMDILTYTKHRLPIRRDVYFFLWGIGAGAQAMASSGNVVMCSPAGISPDFAFTGFASWASASAIVGHSERNALGQRVATPGAIGVLAGYSRGYGIGLFGSKGFDVGAELLFGVSYTTKDE